VKFRRATKARADRLIAPGRGPSLRQRTEGGRDRVEFAEASAVERIRV